MATGCSAVNVTEAENAAVCEVFHKYFDRLVSAMTSPTAVAAALYSKYLISFTDKNIPSIQGIGVDEKASRLLNAAQTTIGAAPNATEAVRKFCSAVEDQPAMKHVADRIKAELDSMAAPPTSTRSVTVDGDEATDESIETPQFKLTTDFKEDHEPLSLGDESKKGVVKKFATKVQVVIQTCNPPEYYAALEKLKPPRIQDQEFHKSVKYPCLGKTIVVGTFADIDAAVIKTEQGAKCITELEFVFKNVFTNAKLLLGLGVCYGLKNNFAKHDLKFADVLVGKEIDAILTPKFKGTMDPRGEVKAVPESVQRLFCDDPDISHNFIVCEEPSKRIAKVYAGRLASGSFLMDDSGLLQGLEVPAYRYLGGEMEGWAQIKYTPERVKCIIIKGIADFGSGSKDKVWQLTAAMAAVDYAHSKLLKPGIHFGDSVTKSVCDVCDRKIVSWTIAIIVFAVSVLCYYMYT